MLSAFLTNLIFHLNRNRVSQVNEVIANSLHALQEVVNHFPKIVETHCDLINTFDSVTDVDDTVLDCFIWLHIRTDFMNQPAYARPIMRRMKQYVFPVSCIKRLEFS